MSSEATKIGVLELTQRYAPAIGGVERHVAGVSGALSDAGFHVEVATSDLARDRPFGRLPAGAPTTVDGVRVRRHRAVRWAPLPHGLGIVAPGLAAEVLRTRARIVHAHAFGYFPTWAAAAARRLRKFRLVVTPHSDVGSGTPGSRTYGRIVARGTMGGAEHVIALTHGEARLLEERGVARERISVLPNGIDLREFPEPAPAEPGATLRVLFVGRIYAEQKGLDVLIDALGALRGGPPVAVRLVGEDWGSWTSLAARAERLGVSEAIAYRGPRPRAELLAELARADVVVVPSRFEPFGIVILEAMASGRAVVASRVGGIPEIVRDGETGVLVAPGDPAALADALARLAGDPERVVRLGQHGRERVLPYGWGELGPRYVELFRRVAE